MSFLGALGKVGGRAGRAALYPITKPTELIMNAIIKTTLLSILKGLVATAIAALTALAATPPASGDAATVFIWGLIINGIHALITFIQHSTAIPPAPAK